MSRLEAAVEAHRAAFGVAPGLYDLRWLNRDDELAAAVEAAVAAGKPLDVTALERSYGMLPVPPYAHT